MLRTIVSQTKVHLDLLRLTAAGSSISSSHSRKWYSNFIVSQTKVELHRLTNESASRTSSSHRRTSSSHRRKCIFIVSQTKVELELHRLTIESASRTSSSHISNFIFSQSKVVLELHRLTNESAYRTNFIVSQTKVELHRLTNESASRTSSSHALDFTAVRSFPRAQPLPRCKLKRNACSNLENLFASDIRAANPTITIAASVTTQCRTHAQRLRVLRLSAPAAETRQPC